MQQLLSWTFRGSLIIKGKLFPWHTLVLSDGYSVSFITVFVVPIMLNPKHNLQMWLQRAISTGGMGPQLQVFKVQMLNVGVQEDSGPTGWGQPGPCIRINWRMVQCQYYLGTFLLLIWGPGGNVCILRGLKMTWASCPSTRLQESVVDRTEYSNNNICSETDALLGPTSCWFVS